MTEEVVITLSPINLTAKVKRENKNKKIAKTSKISQEDFEILKLNEHDELLKNNYSVPQLKEMCRYYELKVSGNKDEVTKRLYNYLSKSFFAIKIQRLFRRYIIIKYNKCHGPAFIKRRLCVNDNDFLTMEDIKEIPYNQFYSYKSTENHIYGFDVISLYNLISRPDVSPLNPYTRTEFPVSVKSDLKKLIKLSKLLKIKMDIELEKEESVSLEKQIEISIISLFQKMDELGNYTNTEWFNSLTAPQITRFVRELYDIWAYRAQLAHSTKREICPPNGDPFRNVNMNNFYACDFIYLKSIALKIMENLVYSGINRENQFLGSSYVLSALTLVSDGAADAMPWLYQSVAHVII